MRTTEYALTGKGVPAALAGTKINFRQPETLDEARSLFADEQALVDSASNDFDVWLQGRLRAMAAQTVSKEDKTLKHTPESLQKFATEARKARRAAGAGPKEVKPETKQARAEKGAGNKLFEKCRADEAFRARMIKLGAIEQADYDEWLAAQAPQAPTPVADQPAA